MNNFTPYSHTPIDKSITRRKSFVFRYVLLFLFSLLTANNFSAQRVSGEPNQSLVSVSVIGDAQIYSADLNFNQQIADKKINIKGSVRKAKLTSGSVQLIVTNAKFKKAENRTLAYRAHELKRKKEAIILKKVNQQLAKYEHQKKNHEVDVLNLPGSSNLFFSSKQLSDKAAVPGISTYKFAKVLATTSIVVANRALDTLYTQKFTSYDSRSKDHCYSTVFSVRPPPVLA